MPDTRPLHVRVQVLAERYDALALGAGKRANQSRQDAGNHRRDAATLHEAADALSRVGQVSFRQTWPYAVVFPDNAATPGGHNVRKPDGTAVFRQPVEQGIAQQACDALNQGWSEDRGEAGQPIPTPP